MYLNLPIEVKYTAYLRKFAEEANETFSSAIVTLFTSSGSKEKQYKFVYTRTDIHLNQASYLLISKRNLQNHTLCKVW